MNVELHFLGRELNLVVPKQAGLDFESAAPRLAALAARLQSQYNLPVRITTEPERHLHGPAELHAEQHRSGELHAH